MFKIFYGIFDKNYSIDSSKNSIYNDNQLSLVFSHGQECQHSCKMSPAAYFLKRGLESQTIYQINKKINIILVSSTRAIHRAQNDVAKRVSNRIYRPSKVQ